MINSEFKLLLTSLQRIIKEINKKKNIKNQKSINQKKYKKVNL